MAYNIDESIISKSIEHYGEEIQSTVCMEECAELIQAISKMKRNEDNKGNLTEEIADVLVCIETLKHLYSLENSDINNWIRQKQQRQLRRMKLPEKDTGDYPANTFDAGHAEGWNTCIDEITGDSKWENHGL